MEGPRGSGGYSVKVSLPVSQMKMLRCNIVNRAPKRKMEITDSLVMLLGIPKYQYRVKNRKKIREKSLWACQ